MECNGSVEETTVTDTPFQRTKLGFVNTLPISNNPNEEALGNDMIFTQFLYLSAICTDPLSFCLLGLLFLCLPIFGLLYLKLSPKILSDDLALDKFFSI